MTDSACSPLTLADLCIGSIKHQKYSVGVVLRTRLGCNAVNATAQLFCKAGAVRFNVIPLFSVSRRMLPKDSGDIYTAQVHQATAKLEQQVSSLTAALEGSKQREGLTAHKLSQREQQLQTVSKLLKIAIQDSLREEHDIQTELKINQSLPSTLPSTSSRSRRSLCSLCTAVSLWSLKCI